RSRCATSHSAIASPPTSSRESVAANPAMTRFSVVTRGRAVLSTARMEDMVRQTDQIINFTNEINRRIAEAGITGVEGLVGLYDQLRSALGKVSQQELEWAQGEVNRVLERLRRLSEELSHLAALKAALETGH